MTTNSTSLRNHRSGIGFTLLTGDYTIYRFKNDSPVPGWVYDSEFYSITRTHDELSVVCNNVDFPSGINIMSDKHWRVLKINGPLELSLVGIIANISNLLKENKIPVFIVSTYDTDYILVRDKYLKRTLKVLNNAGHPVLEN